MEDAINPNGYDANDGGSTWFAATSEAVVKTQTANAEQPINSATVGTQAWLVKIPKFVKEQWDKVGATPGIDLGVLRVYRQKQGSKAPPKITLHLPTNPMPGIADHWTDTLPKNYTLNLTNAATANTHVMTTTEAQDVVTAFTATVVHEATVTPSIDESYRALMKKRQEDEVRKKRNIVEITMDEAKKKMRIQAANVATVDKSIIKASQNAIAVVTGRTNQADKRERMEKADLINALIVLFHQNQYYKFAELVEKTQQPHAWLKEVLSDVAVLVKKGLYNGMYELKPEYAAVGKDDE
ncbi:hypothetical protein BCR33DRAFT_711999 [Rhizoclosmatium globosum]|uniref:Transcription initiation factor IIF subunit beta n=1 Tax=Rhizoclosmatium globosum TaxID=329046 RepID=A0A1Y2CXP3_9FUNG|nr:hypothetical protein BCR33DRAFT_711999 [Rhizoclosmatium globosum]|eukprot:ORY51801.1 hypothetical protein BCR33DRAFT_711999 [Rhizoclosmatium globosum]